MAPLHLAFWSLPELVVAIFAVSVLLISYIQPLSSRQERAASKAFRWIVLAIAAVMFLLFLQHSSLISPSWAMWGTYLVATTLGPLGIRAARASGHQSTHVFEWVYWLVSLGFGLGLAIFPKAFVAGPWSNPVGITQASATTWSTALVLVQMLAAAFSSRRLYRLGRFGPMDGARTLTLMWVLFGITGLIDQLGMQFRWPIVPVFWIGCAAVVTVFTRVIGLHHQRVAHRLQLASLERAKILEHIALNQPLAHILSSIDQLPPSGRQENQHLAQTAHEHHRLLRDLEFRATHDPLTGLANRTYLQQRLGEMLNQSHVLALMVIDLNGFKRINDTLGHAVGDALLIQVAQRLEQTLGAGPLLARFGGDEFVALLPKAGPTSAIEMAHRITESLKEPFELLGLPLFVSASIGVGFADSNTSDLVLLHAQADMAMYYAKEHSTPWMIYQSNMGRDFEYRLALENALRESIKDFGQFSLVYQPILTLKNATLIGFEALLRWNSPTLGPVTPLKFIPIAEESGLMVLLGSWVLQTACHQAAQWQGFGHPLVLNVNVSAQQFEHPEFVTVVKKALDDSGLPPECLTLEVVESVIMRRLEEVSERFHQLRDLGVKIALDDFGTGFSSLNYIHQLPFDTLKIDRSFVQPLGVSAKAHALIDSIVYLAHSLEKKVVVEGIETNSQHAILRDLRCEYAQGYLFAKPLAAVDAQAFIQQNQRYAPDGSPLPEKRMDN